MRKIFIILVIFSLIFMVSCNQKEENKDDEKIEDLEEGENEMYKEYIDNDHSVAEIEFSSFGKVIIQLDKANAPITVAHFTKLANNKDYDGAFIIRNQEGFVLQGGQGCKDDSTIKGEFQANGVDNKIVHDKGVISMARANDYNSGSNQFFIVTGDNAQSSLDGLYAGFGKVVEGWDVVEAICASIKDTDYSNDYYGFYMGFLKEESYIVISSIRVYE